jgi:hypothetical protein
MVLVHKLSATKQPICITSSSTSHQYSLATVINGRKDRAVSKTDNEKSIKNIKAPSEKRRWKN